MPFRSHSTSPTPTARPTSTAGPSAPAPKRRGFMARFAIDLQAAALEYIGTVMFLLIGLGGIQAVTAQVESGQGPSSLVERDMYVP
jgi:aquaporin related protein